MADTGYVATSDIYVTRGVRAFRKGDTVPEGNALVETNRDKLVRPSAKAAKVAQDEAKGEVASEQ